MLHAAAPTAVAISLVGVQNHCCAPSMYTKVVEVEGESRLVFFARTDLKPGQELTYDYRYNVVVGMPQSKASTDCYDWPVQL